ncbi:hypothetical protein FGW37_22480 [Streptomyces rectiverticillatus]|uniref:hypothetical protein n=1 Tax=Streptomyces rectiverticillatus TaxID=173860 RepID=UPI0015C2E586|nr:hypothetical protein [Streptomyces rectiverticillatus]QLE73976.1 hypothetical protein FGW37_22480 [Streptomyces rectiverticillatus]
MDEGLAVLIAGGCGLLGALAAAVGAMRGARLGATKALETTLAQVAGQESAEHRHWAREQRMSTLMDAVDQLTTMDRALGAAGVKLALGNMPSASLHEEFMTSNETFVRAIFRLGVWGPDQARVLGQRIHDLIRHVYESWAMWEAAVNSGTPTDIHQETFRARRAELHAPWSDFLNLAARALREPEQAS